MSTPTPLVQETMQRLKCCVLVPTYNNAGTLQKVLDGILRQTTNVIVVNDGATDDTKEILTRYSEIHQVHIPHNRGKGNTLQIGFKEAIKQDYEFAISIDSDGQHFPEDIQIFLEVLQKEETKNVLLNPTIPIPAGASAVHGAGLISSKYF